MSRRLALTLSFACVTAAWLGAAHLRTPSPRATVEPTLPLVLDLSIRPGAGDADGVVLTAVVEAKAAIADLDLDLLLPPGLRAGKFDAVLLGNGRLHLGPAERRVFVLPLRVGGPGVHDLRLEATFTLQDGRTFRTLQGATVRHRVPENGRHNAGAWEVMAVPATELAR